MYLTHLNFFRKRKACYNTKKWEEGLGFYSLALAPWLDRGPKKNIAQSLYYYWNGGHRLKIIKAPHPSTIKDEEEEEEKKTGGYGLGPRSWILIGFEIGLGFISESNNGLSPSGLGRNFPPSRAEVKGISPWLRVFFLYLSYVLYEKGYIF